MGEIETAGPGALDLLQRLLSNDVAKLEVGGAQYSVLCREDGGVLDDLFTYRLGRRPLPDRHQRRQPRARPGLVPRARRRVRRRGRRPARRLRDARRAGPDARGDRRRLVDGELPPRMRTRHTPRVGVAGEVLVCGTGYTGEDGVEILIEPDAAPALWDALLAAGAAPAGLGARDTLRLEVCFHLYGNDLSTDRNPIEAGLGWCCKEETGFIGAEAVAAARADGDRAEAGARSRSPRRGSRARATRCSPPTGAGRGGDQRHPLAVPRARDRHGLRARRSRRARDRGRDRRARKATRRAHRVQAPLRPRTTGAMTLADETYPEELKYHAEHDWARIEGDEATFGITWYAQDALGEVVFYEPPEVGRDDHQGRALRRGRVGEGGLRRDRAAVGRDHAVNEELSDSPEKINEDPYGEGWLVKVRLTDTGEVDAAARRRRLPGAARWLSRLSRWPVASLRPGEPLHLRNRRRPGGDAGGDRRRLDRRAVRRHPGRAAPRPRAGAAGRPLGDRGLRPLRGARRAQRRRRFGDSASSAPACTTTTSRRWSTRSSRARSS